MVSTPAIRTWRTNPARIQAGAPSTSSRAGASAPPTPPAQLRAAIPGRLGAERDLDRRIASRRATSSVTVSSGLVLIEPGVRAVGADPEVVDRQYFVVHVEAGRRRRRVAADLRRRPGARRRCAWSCPARPSVLGARPDGSAGRTCRAPRRSRAPRCLSTAVSQNDVRLVPATCSATAAELVGGVAARAGVLGVRRAHHVVEAAAPSVALRIARVEQEADDGALGVVADRRVGRVLVGPVVLDPGVERGQLRRLHQRPGQSSAPRSIWLERLSRYSSRRRQAGPMDRQLAVVVGDALGDPQAARVDSRSRSRTGRARPGAAA